MSEKQESIETIRINDVDYVRKDSVLNVSHGLDEESPIYPFVIGEKYYIEEVTKYFTGVLTGISHCHSETILVFDQCAWIADTGRYMGAMQNGNFNEVEPLPDGPVFISLGANVMIRPWGLVLPRSQK